MFREIATVNIELNTTSTPEESFSIPTFISPHVWFSERIKAYSDIKEALADLPAGSVELAAMQSAFSNTPPPDQVKLARRAVDSVTFTVATNLGAGVTYSLTLVDTSDNPISATFTTVDGLETVAEIAADLVADLSGAGGVTITDNLDGTFLVAKTGAAGFWVTEFTNIGYSVATTETAAQVWQAILEVDSDFYFTATDSRDPVFVEDLSALVNSTENKQFVMSVQTTDNLGVYSDLTTDFASVFFRGNVQKTSVWYHHQSETKFPEMAIITVASTSVPGKKVWGNEQISLEASRNADTSIRLSTTEKNNLFAKRANFIEANGIGSVTRDGHTSSGNWIDEIRDRDFIVANLKRALNDFFVRSPKVPYTDNGIAKVYNVIANTLNRFISSNTSVNILDPNRPYDIRLPLRKDVAFADISARTLSGEVTLYFAGAILTVTINGQATFDAV